MVVGMASTPPRYRAPDGAVWLRTLGGYRLRGDTLTTPRPRLPEGAVRLCYDCSEPSGTHARCPVCARENTLAQRASRARRVEP
jgi:hypothetical protein